jgi:hypothetical protein
MSSPRNSPTNPSSKPVPVMDFHDQKITDVSALLSQYIQDAGGYGTVEGNRYSFMLHEVNGAWSHVNTVVRLAEFSVARMLAETAEIVGEHDLYMLSSELRFGLKEFLGDKPDDRAVQAIVDIVLRSGWKPPVR